jgi:hypothetical protein
LSLKQFLQKYIHNKRKQKRKHKKKKAKTEVIGILGFSPSLLQMGHKTRTGFW